MKKHKHYWVKIGVVNDGNCLIQNYKCFECGMTKSKEVSEN